MKFETQRQLLEYLGKNVDDRKLVQRMIIRGEVVKEDGMYCLIGINKKNLIEEVKELKLKLLRLEREHPAKEGINELNKLLDKTVKEKEEIKKELEEAKIQREYYENLYKEAEEDKERKIRKCFSWIKQRMPGAKRDDFIEWVDDDKQFITKL